MQTNDQSLGVPTPVPVLDSTTPLTALLDRRTYTCRLRPQRALRTLEEAETFLAERGMVTLTPDCALPSLFAACHEEPYLPGGRGFASWPKTKWSWGFALGERPGVHVLKLHRGKSLFLSSRIVALADPLCRGELARTEQGAYGPSAAELVGYLAAVGPMPLDDIKRELGLDAAALRAVRERLERVGAVVSRLVRVVAQRGGERETSELARWDQHILAVPTVPDDPDPDPETGLEALVVAGVRAAVVAPEREIRTWFSWPLPHRLLGQLIEQSRLWQPQEGWVTVREEREFLLRPT
jgi:hypothetical protein